MDGHANVRGALAAGRSLDTTIEKHLQDATHSGHVCPSQEWFASMSLMLIELNSNQISKNVGGLGGLGGWCVAWWVLWEVLACKVGVCDDGPRLSEWVGRHLAVGVDAGVGFR